MVLYHKKRQLLQTVIVVAGLFSISLCNAQKLSNPLHAIKESKEFIYGIDNRRTHIKAHSTLIYGAYIGIVMGDKLRFKIGVSGTPFERGKFIDEQGLLKKNRLIFANLGEEFDFLIINRFRLTTYFQSGIGYNHYRKINALGVETEKGKNLIIPLEAGIHANYDLLPWLRAKLGGGWRFVPPAYSYDLSGYYIKIGFSVKTKKLWALYQNRKHEKTMNE